MLLLLPMLMILKVISKVVLTILSITMLLYYFVIIITLMYTSKFTRALEECLETKVGRICGSRSTDGNYSMYLGIPYAKVDESNPFGVSTTFPNFSEAFEAVDGSSKCPQLESDGTIVGSLDCLRLNIFVPKTITTNRLPVMIFIHGGFLERGWADRAVFGPEYLIRHDVILVTINYRVGLYGFMCLQTPAVPGNQGLKDQALAFRWVRDNIVDFGGDANSVTIFGASAGARSIDLHLLSPQERLFDKVILQSGSVLNPGWFPKPDLEAPIKIAALLGFHTTNTEEALAFISKTNSDLVLAQTRDMSFRLCIEKDNNDIDRFITESPLTANVTKAKDTAILLGYNSQEMLGSYVNKDEDFFGTLNIFHDKLSAAFNFSNQTQTELEQLVRKFYIGDEIISDEVKLALADFDSDITYSHPTARNLARYLHNGAKDIYYYVFSYNGERNLVKRSLNITFGGACHGDEQGYLFYMEDLPSENSADDQKIIDVMTTMWTNFAKTGVPIPEPTTLLPVEWKPVNIDSVQHFLDIDLELRPGVTPFHDRFSFWDLLFQNYNEFQNIYEST